ncbi:aldehyde dehydrogenase family 16 member A1 [Silurus meridionalis]|nr:aldehyde dehydrogenase family 16 member A1 [Silurus meridionalis]
MAEGNSQTVYSIFQFMELGPSNAGSTVTAQSWLEQHSRSLGLFIDGKFVHPENRETLTLSDSKGEKVCSILCANDEDILSCSSSAAAGFKVWKELSDAQRAKVLLSCRQYRVNRHQVKCAPQVIQGMGAFYITRNKENCSWKLCTKGLVIRDSAVPKPDSDAAVQDALHGSATPLIRLAQYYTGWAQLRHTLLPEWTPRGVVAVVMSDDAFFYSMWLKVIPALAVDLTGKGQAEHIPLMKTAELAFQALKTTLTSALVLRNHNFNRSFIHTSETGQDAMLFQIFENDEHPVHYASNKMTPGKQNYATVEREALAIKSVIEELRYCPNFTLITDQAPLQ